MTVWSTGVVPVSSTNTPDERLTLPVRVSALNVSASGGIGSGGAGMRASDGSGTGGPRSRGDAGRPRRYTEPPADRPNPRANGRVGFHDGDGRSSTRIERRGGGRDRHHRE